jgi:hypothetical protein
VHACYDMLHNIRTWLKLTQADTCPMVWNSATGISATGNSASMQHKGAHGCLIALSHVTKHTYLAEADAC